MDATKNIRRYLSAVLAEEQSDRFFPRLSQDDPFDIYEDGFEDGEKSVARVILQLLNAE